MALFNQGQPIIRRKQEALDFQDRQGLWKFKVAIHNKTLFSSFYTRIDQVFVVWGLITGMTILTHFWVKVERLRWVLYAWIILMLGGVVITDFGILLGWSQVLMNLCPLWLSLSAFGYFCTGWGLRSRAFIFAGLVHLLGMLVLPYFIGWQFLATGVIMAANLLMFAETQWDMRPPIENYALLTEQEKQFNREQNLIRQTGC